MYGIDVNLDRIRSRDTLTNIFFLFVNCNVDLEISRPKLLSTFHFS